MTADSITLSECGMSKTKYREFRQSKRDLYYTDMSNRGTFMILATVEEKKPNYLYQECNRACAERNLQETTWNTSTKDILYMINKIIIPNQPITCDDLKAANDMFGTIIRSLRVKTVQKPGEHVRLEIEKTPAGVIYRYKNANLTSDIIFVNKIRFLLLSPGTFSLEPQK